MRFALVSDFRFFCFAKEITVGHTSGGIAKDVNLSFYYLTVVSRMVYVGCIYITIINIFACCIMCVFIIYSTFIFFGKNTSADAIKNYFQWKLSKNVSVFGKHFNIGTLHSLTRLFLITVNTVEFVSPEAYQLNNPQVRIYKKNIWVCN